MSRQGPAARTVAHSGPPRWDATPARMGFAGTCDVIGVGAHLSHPTRVFPQPARNGIDSKFRAVICRLSRESRNAL